MAGTPRAAGQLYSGRAVSGGMHVRDCALERNQMAVLDASDKLTLDRAKSAELSRDYDMAERLYKELLQKDDSNIELLSALGKLYEKDRKFPEALAQYEKVLALDPKNMGALNSLGSILP